jgi:hypothetical protein
MDLPGDKIEGMAAGVLDKILNESVPGKLMALVAASLEITESGATAHAPERERKRKLVVESPRVNKPNKTIDFKDEANKGDVVPSEARGKRTQEEAGVSAECVASKEIKTQRKAILSGGCTKRLAPIVESVAEDEEELKSEPKSTVTDKAVKSDKAEVPKHLWNSRVFELESLKRMDRFNDEEKETILDKMQKALHVVWKRKVERNFVEWFHASEHRFDKREDIWLAGLRACVYALRSNWWEWTGGSHIFFWRWPACYKDDSRAEYDAYESR